MERLNEEVNNQAKKKQWAPNNVDVDAFLGLKDDEM